MALEIKYRDYVEVYDYDGNKYKVEVKMLNWKERIELLKSIIGDKKIVGGNINPDELEIDPFELEEKILKYGVVKVIRESDGSVVENKIEFLANLPIAEANKVLEKIIKMNEMFFGKELEFQRRG